MSGTSMSSPFAASVAILIRAAYQWLDVNEAEELLFEGADDIYNLNDRYRGQLGAGRINAYESLRLGQRPALIIEGIEIVFDENDNDRFDVDEVIEFVINISNNEGAIETEGLIVTLTTEDEMLNIQTDEVIYPDVEPGETIANEDEPFVIEVSGDAIPHTTWITVLVEADPGGIEIEQTFEIIVGHPDILIVDDDDGDDIEQYYLSDVEAMGQGWVRWNVATDYSPDLDVLTDYEMVVWVTGNADPPLDELDKVQIESAILEDANVLLIGNRIGNYRDNQEFLMEYFGAEHEEDSVRALSVNGIPGDRPIAEGTRLYLFGDDAADFGDVSPSTMVPVMGADSLLIYVTGGDTLGVAAVSYQSEWSDGKSIYFGFAFEGSSGRQTPRSAVLENIYEWFISEDNGDIAPLDISTVTSVYSLSPAFPNPFNSLVKLTYHIPCITNYNLSIIDLSGREITLLNSGISEAGEFTTLWNSTDTPSGIYFARLSVPGRAPIERRLVLIK